MKVQMQIAESNLAELLAMHEVATGLLVRVHGDNLIMSRREPIGPNGELQNDDRVRLTRLSSPTMYGLSVKRHTGRWERTPFSGTMPEMVDTIVGCMQHLIAHY